jgi:hypothetical protein
LVRDAHAHIFKKRPGQLIVNRIKDAMHFYTIGIGMIPATILLFLLHITYGKHFKLRSLFSYLFPGSSCELTDYPTDGTIPHHWQFERTPLRQFWQKYFGQSDAERHERMLAYNERNVIFARWR